MLGRLSESALHCMIKKSFTAKDTKDAEEKNSFTAKDAKAAKKSIIRTKP